MAKRKTPSERVNITVPQAVRKRMEKRPEVNWSQVATSAFETVLNEKEADMATAISRLKQTKVEKTKDDRPGYGIGRSWAKKSASFRALKRVASIYEKMSDEARWVLFGINGIDNAYSSAERVATLIETGEISSIDRDVSSEFWESLCDDKNPEDEFVEAFCDGAYDFWILVEDKV